MRMFTGWAIASVATCMLLIAGLHAGGPQPNPIGWDAKKPTAPSHVYVAPEEAFQPAGCISGQSCLNCSCGSSCQCYESARLRKEIQRKLKDLNKPDADPNLLGFETKIYLRIKERRIQPRLIVEYRARV